MTFLVIALVISILVNVIMMILLYKTYRKYSSDKIEKHMLLTILEKEQADEESKREIVLGQSPQICIFNDDKFLGDYPMYEVTLEITVVKENKNLVEKAKLSIKKSEKSQIDLSSKYVISVVGKSDCLGQITHIVYERYGELHFPNKEEFILANGKGFALVFDIKDKPQSILVAFRNSQVVYNVEQHKGNIIFPSLDTPLTNSF